MGKLLLRSGKGDDKSLIKAVFIIESQLPGTKIVPDGWRKLFAKWWQVENNESKVAFLPNNLKKGSVEPADPFVFVKAGAPAPSGDSYANLENVLLRGGVQGLRRSRRQLQAAGRARQTAEAGSVGVAAGDRQGNVLEDAQEADAQHCEAEPHV